MWTLVKADFHYTRFGLGVVAILVAFFFWLDATVNGWHFYTFVNNSAVVAMIGMGVMAAGVDKERRDRAFIRLPVPIASVGVARLIYVWIVLTALMPVWSLYLVLSPQGGSIGDVWVMFNAAAIAFIVFALFAINHDLGYYDSKKYRYRMYAGLAAVLVLLAVLGFNHVLDWLGPAYGDFLLTLPGVIVHMAIACTLFFVELRVFAGRRSYLS